MGNFENYILSAIFLLVFCAIFYLWKKRGRTRQTDGKKKFIDETFELARAQFEIFNIRLYEGGSRAGLAAMLHDVDNKGLYLEVGDYVSEEWDGQKVEVYFKVRRDDVPVFYVFSSKILELMPDYGASRLVLQMPEHLRVEKKRHFIRVVPPKSDVGLIGVWPLLPGKKLPRSTGDIGSPIIRYKAGKPGEAVQLENISGAGIALRVNGDVDPQIKAHMRQGANLLCLIVYTLNGQKVVFWCTGEVMNARNIEGDRPAVVLGLEFTNWAVIEPDQSEIHWAHSSPSRGAKPILQWVEQIDKNQKPANNNSGKI